jgi:hypothetical protein
VTPTLAGRVQTRVALLAAIGVPLCYFMGREFGDARSAVTLVGYVMAFGLVWDPVYHWLQGYRWDQDWPPWLAVAAAFGEGAVLWLALQAAPVWDRLELPGLPGVRPMPGRVFAAHYGGVWLATYLAAQGPLRVLFPHWRLSGGRFV